MTYVSRRARIIAPRWPNESDTEFLFRTRRRCDGRLKRHSSSLDLRAWINNNCIKHEYLLELMSDGEVTLTPPVQLYGRFIPVPLLFKLTQKTLAGEGAGEETGEGKNLAPFMMAHGSVDKDGIWDHNYSDEMNRRYSRHEGGSAETVEIGFLHSEPAANDDSNMAGAPRPAEDQRFDAADDHRSDSQTSLSRILWEKDVIEKNLFKSACLLSKALGKLEKIDSIIQVANEETEAMRKQEIQEAFRKPKKMCFCNRNVNNTSENGCGWVSKGSSGNDDEQRIRNENKCNELLRQISGLREKLKKNQDCRQKICLQVGMIRRRTESSSSTAETYNQREHPELKKLEKKLEKLVNERGKLLSEMCQALTCLNSMKKYTNSKSGERRRSKSDDSRNGFSAFLQEPSTKGGNNSESYGTETNPCCDAMSSDDDQHSGYPCYDCSSVENLDLGQVDDLIDDYCSSPEGYSAANEDENALNNDICKRYHQEKDRKMRFVCQPCKRKLEAEMSSFEGGLSSEHPSRNGGTFGGSPCRPSTSPTTGREKRDAWVVRCTFTPRQNCPPCQKVQGRRVKSETTMKEIEKTLRNYEQRLSDMDGLEYRVEEWKRKLMEACRWKKNMSKMETEREAEREKSGREIQGLFSENRELKKQVRELMDKSKEQAMKIHNLKFGMMKSRDLETETEELKKELSEYRNCYEHQRKCISKWESVVALQRKEIENLMNHIRKLTTERMKEKMGSSSDRRYGQRSRSYSPEALAEGQETERSREYDPYDENGSCCCQEFRQSESRRTQLRCFDKSFYSSVNGTEDWCN